MGTPPPEGQMISEVATSVVIINASTTVPEVGPVTINLELPLPEFESDGQPALPSQCLWSVVLTDLDYQHTVGEGSARVYFDYSLVGRELQVIVRSQGFSPMIGYISYEFEVTAVAISTTGPVGVESMSWGAVKGQYRE